MYGLADSEHLNRLWTQYLTKKTVADENILRAIDGTFANGYLDSECSDMFKHNTTEFCTTHHC